VLYVGSIFDNAQAYSLIEVARAVARLNVNGHKFDFDIYSPRHLAEPFRKDLEISHAVRLHDAIIDDDVFFSMIHDADILVLPVNFDPTSIRLIRYSMPTKLPAYLASGTPVLVYGPAGVAQVDDAARHGWGLVVDHQGMTGVADALLKLSQDPTLAKALTDRARALVEERHDAHTVRARFQKRLAAAGTVRP
jgi:glycosyltransferase involved in cell wall biosynthesis